MKYYKTLKTFTIQDKNSVFVEISLGAYLRYSEACQEYLTLEYISIPVRFIKANPTYFEELDEKTYNRFTLEVTPITLMIKKLMDDTGYTVFEIMERLDADLGIVRNMKDIMREWYSTHNQIIPEFKTHSCTACGNDGTKACWSVSCPNRLNITY